MNIILDLDISTLGLEWISMKCCSWSSFNICHASMSTEDIDALHENWTGTAHENELENGEAIIFFPLQCNNNCSIWLLSPCFKQALGFFSLVKAKWKQSIRSENFSFVRSFVKSFNSISNFRLWSSQMWGRHSSRILPSFIFIFFTKFLFPFAVDITWLNDETAPVHINYIWNCEMHEESIMQTQSMKNRLCEHYHNAFSPHFKRIKFKTSTFICNSHYTNAMSECIKALITAQSHSASINEL